jgi:hypothetical protein
MKSINNFESLKLFLCVESEHRIAQLEATISSLTKSKDAERFLSEVELRTLHVSSH